MGVGVGVVPVVVKDKEPTLVVDCGVPGGFLGGVDGSVVSCGGLAEEHDVEVAVDTIIEADVGLKIGVFDGMMFMMLLF